MHVMLFALFSTLLSFTIGAQQLLSTHLICRSLACGGRHGAQPREDRSTCTGHVKGGVRGVVKAGGPTASVCLSGWDC